MHSMAMCFLLMSWVEQHTCMSKLHNDADICAVWSPSCAKKSVNGKHVLPLPNTLVWECYCRIHTAPPPPPPPPPPQYCKRYAQWFSSLLLVTLLTANNNEDFQIYSLLTNGLSSSRPFILFPASPRWDTSGHWLTTLSKSPVSLLSFRESYIWKKMTIIINDQG